MQTVSQLVSWQELFMLSLVYPKERSGLTFQRCENRRDFHREIVARRKANGGVCMMNVYQWKQMDCVPLHLEFLEDSAEVGKPTVWRDQHIGVLHEHLRHFADREGYVIHEDPDSCTVGLWDRDGKFVRDLTSKGMVWPDGTFPPSLTSALLNLLIVLAPHGR